jgi:hypothetical protein
MDVCHHTVTAWVIRADLAQHDIAAQRWELEALARGAKVKFGDIPMQYEQVHDWAGF